MGIYLVCHSIYMYVARSPTAILLLSMWMCGCIYWVCTGLLQLNHCPRMKGLVFIQSFPATLYTTTTLLGETNVSFWIQNNKEPSFVHFHSVYPVYKEKGFKSFFYLSLSFVASFYQHIGVKRQYQDFTTLNIFLSCEECSNVFQLI